MRRITKSASLALGLMSVVLLQACDDDVVSVNNPGLELVPPDVLDFGDVQVGTTRQETLRIKNPGLGVLTLKGVSPAGELSPVFSYELAQDSVPPNGETVVTVTFAPTELGEQLGTLVVQPDDSVLTDKNVTIRGNGVTATLVVVPAPLSFGNVVVDTVKTVPVEVTNNSNIDASVDILFDTNVGNCADGSSPATFCVDPPRGADANGRFNLAAGASVFVDVSFKPDVAGFTERGKFKFKGCEQTACEIEVDLDGFGIEQGFVCDPPTLDFGQVNPGSCVTSPGTCRNVANEQVTIVNWQKFDPPGMVSSPDFEVEPFTTPVVLEEGDSVAVDVTYCPGELGNDRGTLQLETNNQDPRRKFVLLDIVGTGGGPDIDVTPLEVNFGEVSLIAPSRRTIAVTNVGFDALDITSVEVDLDRTGAFTSMAGAATVPVGGFLPVVVEFQPTEEGPVESRLVIHSTDADEPSVEVILRGEGINLPPCSFDVAPTSMSFGAVERGRQISRSFEIRNTGNNDCLLTAVRVATDPAQAFSLPDGDIVSERVGPGAAQTVRVEYAPTTVGAHQGQIEFSISSPDSPFNLVDLSGQGADATILIVPNDIDFGVVPVDCSARSRTVTIYNTGSVNARLDTIRLEAGTTNAFTLSNIPAPLPASPLNLAPGGSTSFDIGFTADAESSYAGAVEIVGTFNNQPVTYIVALQGRGAVDARQTDEFEQLGRPKVDILFVVDDSCSMSEEQQALSANFDAFIQFAQAQQLDYQIGATTTDIGDGNPAEEGRLVPLNGTQADRIVTPRSMPSPELLFAQNANVGIDNSTFTEAGLEAAYLALTNPLIFGHNAGFLRPDAVLSIIFVSDEVDQSPEPVDFYVNFFLSIKGFRNTNLFTASAIAGPTGGGASCSAQAAPRYEDVSLRTGGVFASICSPDWSRVLEDLSTAAFGFKSRFFLTNQPVVNTIEVYVDDVLVEPTQTSGTVLWQYDVATNSINFSPFATPEPGAHIRVEYAVECL